MPRWSPRQVLALFLGLFVGLSLSLSAVQASTMAAKMGSMSGKMVSMSDMANAAHNDCKGCGGGDEGTTKAAPCTSFCVPPTFAIGGPITPSFAAPMKVVDQVVTADFILAGKTIPPDPHPPRSAELV